MAISAPAMPVEPAASAQATACMRSGRMPMSCAAVASSETASMRLPSDVRVRIRCSSRVTSEADRAGEQAGRIDADAAEDERRPEDVVRQRLEVGAEVPERGVAQQQRQAEGAQDLRQHRPAS